MKIKYPSLVLFLIFALSIFTSCSPDRNYGNKLPPDFPSSIPIIQGTLEDSRSTKFDDGKGFVIGIRTPLSYEESINFYKKSFEAEKSYVELKNIVIPTNSSQKIIGMEVSQGQIIILLEISSEPGKNTYVNLAVHLRN